MKNIKYLLVLMLSLTGTFAFSADDAAMDRPSFFASQTLTVSAAVEAIDHDTRVVTLRKSDGETITLTAGEEVRNLDQVEVGDSLVAEYTLSVSVEVLENDGVDPEAAQASALVRAETGQKPGMAAMDASVVVATVEDINLEANTFRLKLPDGAVNEYVARNPQNLKRAAVGDLVVITTTESVAIAVQEQP